VLAAPFEVEVFDENNLDEIADAIVEEVTDFTQWCVVSLNYRQVTNTQEYASVTPGAFKVSL
jgi:hypothetical protein